MSCYIKLLTDKGLQPVDYTAESLVDAAQYEPQDGVYTITSTYNTYQVLKLNAHLDRLERSARLMGIDFTLDRAKFRAALRQMITESGYGNVRFRATVSKQNPEALILSIEPFTPPAADVIQTGVKCLTTSAIARHTPEAKYSQWMHDRSGIQKPEGITEVFLKDAEGAILEGTGSNFYAILDGELRTAGGGILYGISRQIVLEVAPDILPLREEPIHVDDLPRVSDAFLTSSSRGIIPVIQIDDIVIGDGHPGEKTLALRQAYDAWVVDHLEDL